jgi:uncharacterized membrane protein YkoI
MQTSGCPFNQPCALPGSERDNQESKMMNKPAITLSLLAALCLLLPGTASAQEHRIKMKDLPPVVQKAVQEQTKDAKILGISKEVEQGKTQYEIETSVNGRTRDMLIDPTGAILEIEEEITLDSLAAEVRAEVEKNIGKSKLLRLESVTKGGTLTGYEASVSRAGKKSEIGMGTDGKLIPQKKKKS